MKVMRVFGLLLMALLLVTMATLPAYASTLPTTVDFDGIIGKAKLMEDGTGWIKVGSRIVLITADTDVDGMLDVGALVEVTAEPHFGKYIGLDVKVVDEITIEGFVRKLDLDMGHLLVDHTKVIIHTGTDVDEDL
ncbi:MAG: hypothetical protein HY667_04365, partial [Chloroflexi bacterium]|nr:hypothetical protein [Chloroflexota bacterium]